MRGKTMLTIAIDEYGHFNHDNNLSFVGGYIYTGDDYDKEKLRLFEFLKETCESFDLKFPKDMHYDREGRNRRQVNYFEENIEKSLMEYLVKNPKYHLICMIKSRKERKDYVNISNLVDDRKANNLYEHMTSSLLRNILLNNIDTKDQEEICIEIPTRVSVIGKHEEEKLQEFLTLGYEAKEIVGQDKYKFYSTDQKTFKTALSAMIMNSHKKHTTRFESINIKSINYNRESVDMAYLYLADIICNCFKRRLDLNRKDYGIQKLHHWARTFTGGREPYLWAYDDIDSVYNTIMEEYKKRDFIGTLKALNQVRYIESDFVKYYEENWFKKIQENIKDAFDINKIGIYISEMDLYYKKKHIDNNEGFMIFDNLWEIAKENEDIVDKADIYHLADIGIRVYNHQGIAGNKNPYYQICDNLKQYVPIETYLDTLNRSIQVHVNEFDFDKAIEKQIYILDCIDILKKAIVDISELNEVDSSISTGMTSRGRALSSLGQLYAFKRNPKAIYYFEEALKEFIMDKGNILITTTHILNFASDQKDIELYQKYAIDYFGGTKEIHQQLSYLVEGRSVTPFSFYTYVKALYNLYIDKVDEELIKRILSLDFGKFGYNECDHPWELIYKNIGMILYEKNNPKLAIKYMEKAIRCIKEPGHTITAINHFTNIQKTFYSKNYKLLEKAIEEFKLWLQEEPNIQNYFKGTFIGKVEDIYNKLYEKFTFTYI